MVYCQALLAGLRVAERQPINLAKEYDIRQGERLGEESEGLSGRNSGRREADERTEATDLRPGKMQKAAMPKPGHLNQMVSEERGKRTLRMESAPYLRKNQCAYCKEVGHWARECPKKKKLIQTLALEDKVNCHQRMSR